MKRTLVVFFLSCSVFAQQDKTAETKCREARRLVADICGRSETCKIKNDKQYDEILTQLRSAPLGGQTINTEEIKKLLSSMPTKDTIADLLSKLGGGNTCDATAYYRLATAVGLYHAQVKIPNRLEVTKATLKNWLEKDMKTEYPTLLSLLIRTKVASQYVSANVVSVSADAKKELEQLIADLDKDKKRFLGPTSAKEEDPASKWDPKTWQTNIKDELTTAKKYSERWLKWMEANWK